MGNYINLNGTGINYDLYTGELAELSLNSKIVVNTINQYSYCIAEEDPEFREALTNSDVLLPDGEGVVLAERLLSGKKIKKISGTDLHQHMLNTLNTNNGSCFYLGSSDSTLQKIKEKISVEYPKVTVGYYSPPFKPTFSNEDNNAMINAINLFEPDVLFIGLTAPKQEKWSRFCHEKINAKAICSIGAVFDFYSETIKRPHRYLVKHNLEWMGRLISDPTRMWKRYIYYGPIYMYYILRLKFNRTYSKVSMK